MKISPTDPKATESPTVFFSASALHSCANGGPRGLSCLGQSQEIRHSVLILTNMLSLIYIIFVSALPLVRPLSVEVTAVGARPPLGDFGASTVTATEGEKVTLLCRVRGARPAASVAWYNGTTLIDRPSEDETIAAVRKLFMSIIITYIMEQILWSNANAQAQSRIIVLYCQENFRLCK